MSYTSNKNLPKVRQRAAELVRNGWSARKVGRYLGFHHTAIMSWVRQAERIGYHPIPTKSSRPKSHPKQLKEEIVDEIIKARLKHKRYAEAVYHELRNRGIKVSLSSVKRTLDRNHLLKKKSPWKRFHPHQERPRALKRGDLVQVDTIHRMIGEKKRLYVFSLIDLYSRDAYAKAYEKMNAKTSIVFTREAEEKMGFHFHTIQSDHGPEFGRWFVSQIKKSHRYSRIGRPNDVLEINHALKEYLRYYKYERVHAGINFLTPVQMV